MFRLGDLLVTGGVITHQQLEEALAYQRTKGGRLGVCLIKLGYLTEDILHSVLTRQFGVALVDLSQTEIDSEVVKLLPREQWSIFAHRLIWHGRRVCFAAKPDCEHCLLAPECPSAQVVTLRSKPRRRA